MKTVVCTGLHPLLHKGCRFFLQSKREGPQLLVAATADSFDDSPERLPAAAAAVLLFGYLLRADRFSRARQRRFHVLGLSVSTNRKIASEATANRLATVVRP